MIRAAVALVLVASGTQFSVSSSVTNAFTPKRVAVVHVHTVTGATCSLADQLTGRRFHGTAAKGRITWRWRPSIWANGTDTAIVRCSKGSFHRSAKAPLTFLLLQQIHVLRDYALHVVYWAPQNDMPADVAPAVSQFEADVKSALDAGATNNPFAIPRGYDDSLGNGDPRIASIDSAVVTDTYPRKPAAGYCRGASGPCLGRPDLDREVTRLATQHGWAADNRSLIMVFTAPSVTACWQPGTCTPGTEVCGFHWLAPAGYAYVDVVMSGNGGACRSSSMVHYAIALIGHEQNEAVVDPQGRGVEVADSCMGQFAPVSINGDTYDLPAIEEPNGKCSFAYAP